MRLTSFVEGSCTEQDAVKIVTGWMTISGVIEQAHCATRNCKTRSHGCDRFLDHDVSLRHNPERCSAPTTQYDVNPTAYGMHTGGYQDGRATTGFVGRAMVEGLSWATSLWHPVAEKGSPQTGPTARTNDSAILLAPQRHTGTQPQPKHASSFTANI